MSVDLFYLRKIFDLRKIFAVPKNFLKSKIYCTDKRYMVKYSEKGTKFEKNLPLTCFDFYSVLFWPFLITPSLMSEF